MRRMHVTGLVALALCIAVVAAMAQSTAKAPAAKPKTAPVAKAPAKAPAAPEAKDTEDEESDESMGGGWHSMHMRHGGPMGPGAMGGWGRGMGRGMGGMHERWGEIAKELDLTSEQRDKIEAIRDRQERAAIDQRAKLEIAQLDMRKLMRADKLDRGAVLGKFDEISRLRAQLEKGRITSLLDMRDVLTPEQQQQLRSLRRGEGADDEEESGD